MSKRQVVLGVKTVSQKPISDDVISVGKISIAVSSLEEVQCNLVFLRSRG